MTEIERARRPAFRLIAKCAAEPWAIDEQWLRVLEGIALREGEGPEAVAARLGRPLDNARTATVRDGVAVIPIIGPIFRYADDFTEISGATTTEAIGQDLGAALSDSAVHGILLDINSPGGQADGINGLAEMIREAAEGSGKPVWSYVGGNGLSAGYWLAAAAGRVVVDRAAKLGSIGVVMAVQDDAPINREGAPKRHRFVSSQSPNKRPDLNSEAGRSTYQELVDDLAEVFISAVAGFRSVSRETVLDRFGRGSPLIASKAIVAGMADAIGSYEGAIAKLAAHHRSNSSRGAVPSAIHAHGETMSTKTEGAAASPAITAAYLREHHASVVSELETAARNAGVKEGAEAERARILGVEAAALPGHEQLIAQLKADGVTTPDQAAGQVIKAERALGGRHLAANREAAAELPAVAALAPATGQAKIDPNLPIDQRAKAEWEADPKIRGEFPECAAYVAFCRASESGRVKLLARPAA